MIRAFGGIVVRVEQVPGGTPGYVAGHDMRVVRERAAELVSELGAFFVDQFENTDNPLAHEKKTATEFWQQCDGDLDAIVAGGSRGITNSLLVAVVSKAF